MFMPIHDLDNPVRRVAWPIVTYTIITINVVVYLVLNAMSSEEAYATIVSLSFKPNGLPDLPEGLAAMDLPLLVTAVTSMFVQYEFWHLVGNMMALWVFGDNVEDALGHFRFLVFYLLCAAAAGYGHALTEPVSIAPLIGASGAVAGVIGAYLVLHPKVRVWVLAFGRLPLRLPAAWVLGAWIAFQLAMAFGFGDTQVAWWAHVAGALAGALLVVPMRRRGVPLFDRGV